MPKLIAKERFYYSGRNVEADEEFEAQEQDVALLTNSVSPRARVPDPATPERGGLFERKDETPSEDDAAKPGRGRYRRRDLRAED